MNRKRALIIILILFTSLFPLIPIPIAKATSSTVYITSDYDDVWITETGNIFSSTSMVIMLDDETGLRSFLRFQDIPLNKGARINYATLYVFAGEVQASSPGASVTIYGIDEPDCAPFSVGSGLWSLERPYTSAHVNWNVSSWAQGWHSVNVTDIVKEIINQYAWETDNNLGLQILGVGDSGHEPRSFEDYYHPYHDAQAYLTIVYDVVGEEDPPEDEYDLIEQYGPYTIWRDNMTFDGVDWAYRKEIFIDGSDDPLTNYQIPITAHMGDAPYLTEFTRSGNNPVYDTPGLGWMVSWYDSITSKIWMFIQDDALDPTIEAFSFSPSDWDDQSEWTDHGTIFTGTDAWNDGHLEPHGVVYETQAMANARSAIGGNGDSTRKLRIYFCGIGDGETTAKYDIGFIYANITDISSWSEFTGNPVITNTPTDGYADPKAVIYDDMLWLIFAEYPGPDYVYFVNSTDGITGWSDKRTTDFSARHVMGSLVPLNDSAIGLINNYIGNEGIGGPDEFRFKVTNDGLNLEKYGETLLVAPDDAGWEDEFRWNTLVIDQNGPALIGGYYYFYYIGWNGADAQIGVARLQYTTPPDNGIDVFLGGGCMPDYSDIRFTASDGSTFLDQVNITQVDGAYSDFWVNVTSIPTNGTSIFIYYGKVGAPDVNDGPATFPFYDDFNRADNATVGNGWTEDEGNGALAIESGALKITQHAHEYSHVERAFPAYLSDFEAFSRMKITDIDASSWAVAIGAYWAPYSWLAIRGMSAVQGFNFEHNDNGAFTQDSSNVLPDFTYFWNDMNLTVSENYTQGNYYQGGHMLGAEWTQAGNKSRSGNWAGAPSLLILGKGMDRHGGSYPNADWDNDNIAPGDAGTQYVDLIFVRTLTPTGQDPNITDFGDEEAEGDPYYFVTDENGTVIPTDGNFTDLDDLEDWIDDNLLNGGDPLDPDPGTQGWDTEGPWTRFKMRLYILVIGLACVFTPLWAMAYKKFDAVGYTWCFLIMVLGVGLLWSITGI